MYHIFAILTLSAFVIFGYCLGKYKKMNYWKMASIPIIIYSLSYGLRRGWGADYSVYYNIFQRNEDTDIVLYIINSIIRDLGLPYYIAFICYSLILCLGFFYMVKLYKKEAIFILPLLYCTCFSAVTLIRFFVGVGFLLIGLYYQFKGKYFKCAIFYLLMIGTHNSLMVMLPFLFVFSKIDIFRNRIIVLSVFSIATFVLDQQFLGAKLVTPFVQFLQAHFSHERLNFYYEYSDVFFSGERLLAISTSETFAYIHKLRMFIVHFFILYYGFSIKYKYKNGVFFYNMSAMALMFFQLVQGFELIQRFVLVMYLFISFILAFVASENIKGTLTKYPLLVNLMVVFSFINIVYRLLFGLDTLLRFNTYIWDF